MLDKVYLLIHGEILGKVKHDLASFHTTGTGCQQNQYD